MSLFTSHVNLLSLSLSPHTLICGPRFSLPRIEYGLKYHRKVPVLWEFSFPYKIPFSKLSAENTERITRVFRLKSFFTALSTNISINYPFNSLSLSLSHSLSFSLSIVSFKCFVVYIISVLFIYLGQGTLPLDTPKAHCYTASPCDTHDAQDWLDQLSLLGWRLTTRLILEPVVLARRCRRHIYTLLPIIETGFLLSPSHLTIRTLGSSKNVN